MASYNKIKFSHLWDKLQGPRFSTIRSWNKEKDQYYSSKIGEKFTVLKVDHFYQNKMGNLICHAYLAEVRAVNPRDLSDELLEIMKMEKALLLTFDKSPVPHQAKLEVR